MINMSFSKVTIIGFLNSKTKLKKEKKIRNSILHWKGTQ